MLSFLFIILISEYLGNFPALASAVCFWCQQTHLLPHRTPSFILAIRTSPNAGLRGDWDSGREVHPAIPALESGQTQPSGGTVAAEAWPGLPWGPGTRQELQASPLTQPSPQSPVTLAGAPSSMMAALL